ncbi:MFS transporter [Cellulomonas sp. S1-8]|uniref:MFS transporter n=1 Tax=Cellulomonas sp. S1-8 TaxID=2904790 RepID=UPI002243C7EA|nr:MFS transporter [Cellulomonas sp. S1-8]UZN01507.1 MFS transporter [Cellulomonas sp. S1-8]
MTEPTPDTTGGTADRPAQGSGSPVTVASLRRRTITVLAAAQVLSGLAAGSIVSVGSLLAVELSGSDAWAGSVTTAATLGAALAALSLARLAESHGRRRALATGLALASTGALGVVLAAVLASFPLLLVASALMGVGAAVNLQSRFAATDLSTPATRSRDLSLVVWTGTVGAVIGPNLVHLDAPLARLTGLPELGAVFLFSAAGMIAALLVVHAGLRPEPLDVVGREGGVAGARAHVPLRVAVVTLRHHPRAMAAVLGIVVAHAVMVAVMSMTPVHMMGHGATVELVGLTVSLHLAAMFALAPVMGVVADRLGPRVVLTGGLVLVAGATAVCGAARGDHVGVTVGLVLLGLGWSAATVAGSSIVAGDVPGPERVTIQGLSDALMSLAGAGGGALAGVALALGGYDGLNVAAAAVTVAGLVAVLLVHRRAPSPRRFPAQDARVEG